MYLLLYLIFLLLYSSILSLDLLNVVVIVVVQIIALCLLIKYLLLESRQEHTLDLDLVHVALHHFLYVELPVAYLAAFPSVLLLFIRNRKWTLLNDAHLALRISTKFTI
jgi:hypothetical protein